MTQQEAARRLSAYFYEWVPSSIQPGDYIAMFQCRDGKLVLPTKAPIAEMQEHTDRLIGVNFHWEYPRLPFGARYV